MQHFGAAHCVRTAVLALGLSGRWVCTALHVSGFQLWRAGEATVFGLTVGQGRPPPMRVHWFLRLCGPQTISSRNFPSPFRRVSVTRACRAVWLSFRACAPLLRPGGSYPLRVCVRPRAFASSSGGQVLLVLGVSALGHVVWPLPSMRTLPCWSVWTVFVCGCLECPPRLLTRLAPASAVDSGRKNTCMYTWVCYLQQNHCNIERLISQGSHKVRNYTEGELASSA